MEKYLKLLFYRAIYKFINITYCSNSFSRGEDADTQYNCEPYFNDKARLEPNNSFDLCRLGCSLFDHFVSEMSELELARKNEEIGKIIEWCEDDKRNILYKTNDEEISDFKLYKTKNCT